MTEKQTALLQQISESDSALSVSSESSMTTWALKTRGLIKTDGYGSSEVAVITADGRYYLKHGRHPRQEQEERQRLQQDPEQAALAPSGGSELIARLGDGDGTVTVPDPGPQTRARWRNAYYDALHHCHIPAGRKLRFTGRQSGDCTFTLVDEEAERTAQPASLPVIEVPDSLDRPHPLVRATQKVLGRAKDIIDTRGRAKVIPLHITRPNAERALRIMHALLTEAESRGYAVDSHTDLADGEAVHRLAVIIGGTAFSLTLTERTSKVPHEPTPKELRTRARSPWIRIPKYDYELNGRLSLDAHTFGTRWPASSSHADGARWTLESRLGRFLRDLEDGAKEIEHRQQEQTRRETEALRQWYAVIVQARRRQIDTARDDALTGQLQRWRRAAEIRAFTEAVRDRRGETVSAAEQDWLRWAEEHASAIDPLSAPLLAPRDPPADRFTFRELVRGDLYAHPWPFDDEGNWVLPEDEPTDQTPRSGPDQG
ncbi:hypothetical protein BIV57_12795 [Mangrovactinospora gilvigrisea]|uniref:PE-PGRS family protein n=1 Tax=Mangrovactinospora gilvigrisea TaxID=1428644 RepID=A0A1J7BEX0_9ACTN|nr:hypothetical protein BIV57_12795 [Mangrovactinospora gilvigrisea]